MTQCFTVRRLTDRAGLGRIAVRIYPLMAQRVAFCRITDRAGLGRIAVCIYPAMALCINLVRRIRIIALRAGIGRVTIRRTGRCGHNFFMAMTQRFAVRRTAGRAGLGRIAVCIYPAMALLSSFLL